MSKGIAFIAYSVRDASAATTFYHDVMGLTPSEMFGDQWAEFDVGGTAFGIGNGGPPWHDTRRKLRTLFEVDDIAAERERLSAKASR